MQYPAAAVGGEFFNGVQPASLVDSGYRNWSVHQPRRVSTQYGFL